MPDIFGKIKKLKDQFVADDQPIPDSINRWVKDAKEARLYAHLLQFDGMQQFLKC